MSNHEEFYDNPEIRAKYIARRTQPDNLDDTLERPFFLELVGNFNQLDKSEQADLVSSRLALQYVENLEPVFHEAYQALRPSGRMIFSVEHPVITSNFASLAEGCRTDWLVDDYFKPGARVHQWLGHEVTKYHRTLEEYLDLITMTGFKLEHIRESRPQSQNFSSQEEYERRMRIPLFLFISARKSC